jgi:hypothetical protein
MTNSLPPAGTDVINMIIKGVKYGCHVGSPLYTGQDIKWQFQLFNLPMKLLLAHKCTKIHIKYNVLTSTVVEYLATLRSQTSQLLLHFHLLAW